jgi:hypothetical protein
MTAELILKDAFFAFWYLLGNYFLAFWGVATAYAIIISLIQITARR